MIDTRIADVEEIIFPRHHGDGGKLCVFEQGGVVPFEMYRIFTIQSDGESTRGNHAHFTCTQLLVCLQKKITVICDDGVESKTFILSNSHQGILVPPGIWASQTYHEEATVLMVICDKAFDPNDYIRDYDMFLKYKN